jgi:outer membrane protein assembly factor BamB
MRKLLIGCFILATQVCQGEWPQYRGAKGDGVSDEKVVWGQAGPKAVWKVPTPAGFSSFAVGAGKVFTIVARSVEGAPLALCVALDAETGKELWATKTGVASFPKGGDRGAEGNNGGDGPRSTPTLSGDRIYVYSAEMVLYCLDAAAGREIWKKDIPKEFSGQNIGWKSAMSPVVNGDLIYIAGGGAGEAMLAFNKSTGATVWKSGKEAMTHATPVVATIEGVKQVIFMMQSGLVSLEAGTGKELWRFRFPYQTATGCGPIVGGNIVFCTAGYEVGGAACEVKKTAAGFEAKELWRVRGNAQVASLWSPPVYHGGYLYGMLSYKEFGEGPLKCVDLKTGEVKWRQPGFGTGNLLLAGNQLVALTDDGRVVMAEASPAAYKEAGTMKAVEGKCWSSPALSDGKLYVRSTREGACLEFKGGP